MTRCLYNNYWTRFYLLEDDLLFLKNDLLTFCTFRIIVWCLMSAYKVLIFSKFYCFWILIYLQYKQRIFLKLFNLKLKFMHSNAIDVLLPSFLMNSNNKNKDCDYLCIFDGTRNQKWVFMAQDDIINILKCHWVSSFVFIKVAFNIYLSKQIFEASLFAFFLSFFVDITGKKLNSYISYFVHNKKWKISVHICEIYIYMNRSYSLNNTIIKKNFQGY